MRASIRSRQLSLVSLGLMRHSIVPVLATVLSASPVISSPSPAPTDPQALKKAEAVAIHHPHPDYPLEARRLHLTGRGIVLGIVDTKTGQLKSVKMEHSTGHAILDDAVLRAFRQWTFRPGTIRQFRIPVMYTMTLPPH
jgi:TonB family protein